VQYLKKKAKPPKCGDCKKEIRSLPSLRNAEKARASKRSLTIRRSHGGSICHNCVVQRIKRAFLIEEQKIVKHVLKQSKKKKAVVKPKAAEGIEQPVFSAKTEKGKEKGKETKQKKTEKKEVKPTAKKTAEKKPAVVAKKTAEKKPAAGVTKKTQTKK